MGSHGNLGYIHSSRVRHGALHRFFTLLPFVLALVLIVAWANSYRLHVVSSGSMSPTFRVGDLTIGHGVDATAIRHGDIVTFRDHAFYDNLVTHRVLTTSAADGKLTMVTRGDANKAWESWQVDTDATVERILFHVPYGGLVVTNRALRISLGVLLVGIAVLLTVRKVRRRRLPQPGVHHPPRLNWLTTGWLSIGAVVLVMSPSFSAWTATDTNANTLNSASVFPATTTYNSCGSGNAGPLTVSSGYTTATVTVKGGQGGKGGKSYGLGANAAGGTAGPAAVMQGTFTVQANEVLNVYVGCSGNAGPDNAASGACSGATGGGAAVNGRTASGKGGDFAAFGCAGAGGSGGGSSAINCASTCVVSGLLVEAGGGGGGGGAYNTVGYTGGNGGGGNTGGTNSVLGPPTATAYTGSNGGTAGGSGGTGGTGGTTTTPGTGGAGANGTGAQAGAGGGYGKANGGVSPCCGGGGGGGVGSSYAQTGFVVTASNGTNAAAGQVSITLS